MTENNRPRLDWGPKKRVNHYGPYAHLNLELNKDNPTGNGHDTVISDKF